MRNLGQFIIMKRLEKKLTQRQLAEITGISNATISRIENGLVDPELSTLAKLSMALEVPYDFMLDKASLWYIQIPGERITRRGLACQKALSVLRDRGISSQDVHVNPINKFIEALEAGFWLTEQALEMVADYLMIPLKRLYAGEKEHANHSPHLNNSDLDADEIESSGVGFLEQTSPNIVPDSKDVDTIGAYPDVQSLTDEGSKQTLPNSFDFANGKLQINIDYLGQPTAVNISFDMDTMNMDELKTSLLVLQSVSHALKDADKLTDVIKKLAESISSRELDESATQDPGNT